MTGLFGATDAPTTKGKKMRAVGIDLRSIIMKNPIQSLSKKEWAIWIGSLLIVTISNMVSGDFELLTSLAALVGVSSLIFAAK